MGLFTKKKKNEVYQTTLNGNTAKGRQELLNELLLNHNDLKVWLDIKNSSLSLCVGKNGKVVGTIDSKITKMLCSKYETQNGLSCDIIIGQNYTVTSKNGVLFCNVTLTIIPK